MLPALLAAIAVLSLTVLAWPSRGNRKAHYKASYPYAGRLKLGHFLTRCFSLAALAAIAGWGYVTMLPMSGLSGHGGFETLSQMDGLLLLFQFLSITGFVGGALVALFNLYTTCTGATMFLAKIWSIALVFAFLVLAWVGWLSKLYAFTTNF
ncbi:hypothetical protein [Altererythrobacter sp. Z27]|uniref:hypothetical protein n=1 Tax=Altererythrobacter sp. Z27 TaxID=3461147 RepID=UPI0040441DBC